MHEKRGGQQVVQIQLQCSVVDNSLGGPAQDEQDQCAAASVQEESSTNCAKMNRISGWMRLAAFSGAWTDLWTFCDRCARLWVATSRFAGMQIYYHFLCDAVNSIEIRCKIPVVQQQLMSLVPLSARSTSSRTSSKTFEISVIYLSYQHRLRINLKTKVKPWY
jgi:hypothetical protein